VDIIIESPYQEIFYVMHQYIEVEFMDLKVHLLNINDKQVFLTDNWMN